MKASSLFSDDRFFVSGFSVGGMTAVLGAMLSLGGLGTARAQDSATAVQQNQQSDVKASAAAQQDGDVQQASALEAGDSHVRIVRLSAVRGAVMMDRKTGRGMEQTIANMPIVEGVRLQTTAGDAEVEFEDGSALRLAPNTLVEFPQLIRHDTGGTASTVKLVQGTMYLNLLNTKGNAFTVNAGAKAITVEPSTHLRLEMAGPKMTLGVFAGNAQVQAGAMTTVVGKKQSFTLGGDVVEPVIAKNVAPGPFDDWDKEAVKYHDQYTKGNTFAGAPGYGLSDLNYYGSFSNVGGCGQMWQPYFVNAAWDPYSNGLWAYYPGAGYSWVSPYPWGWQPFHSGSWSYCPTRGWGWVPGGAWQGLRNVALVTHPISPNTGPVRPKPPLLPPGPGKPTMTMASHTPMTTSKMVGQQGFEFRNNSAGLGVPRGSLGSLSKISNTVEQHGLATRQVYAEPSATGRNTAGAPVTIRPGAPSGGERGNEAYRGGNSGASNTGSNSSHNSGGGNAPSGGGGFGGGGHSGGGSAPASSAPAPSAGGAAPSSAPSGHR